MERRPNSADKGPSPAYASEFNRSWTEYQPLREDQRRQLQSSTQYQRQQHTGFQSFQRQLHNEEQQVLVGEYMTPEYMHKIQPCQAIESTFEETYKPTVSWFNENRTMKSSNIDNYGIDLEENNSTLAIERVNININTVYTVPQTSRYASNIDHRNELSLSNSGQLTSGRRTPSPYNSTSTSTKRTITTESGGLAVSGNYQTIGTQQQGRSVEHDAKVYDNQKFVNSTRTTTSGETSIASRKSPDTSVAPSFLSTLNDISVETGDVARLDVRIVGSQPMELRWVKNGQRILADNRHKIITDGSLHSLYVQQCSSGDEGNYECIVSNAIGEARCGALLVVSDKQASVSRTPEQMSVAEQPVASSSSQAPLASPSSSSEPQWRRHLQEQKLKDQQQLEEQLQKLKHQKQEQQKQSNTDAKQKTHYGLTCNNMVIEGDLYNMLFLDSPSGAQSNEEGAMSNCAPKFLTHIPDYFEREEGQSVHFECCLSPVDDPDLKTEWFFNGRPLVTGSRFHTIDDFGFIVLDIDWLFPRDTGEYICRATNKYGTDITRTVLRVKPDKNIELDSQLDNPRIVEKLRQLEFPDVTHETMIEEPDKPAHFVQHLVSGDNKRHFVEGDNVHFEARVGPATDGTLIVEWFHNDKPLISGHRFKPSFEFGHIVLDILYVYPDDSGVYRCVARNATGSDVSQIEIHVTGKPSIVYKSQLPKEMVGGVQKINEMEAMWNRAPDPEEEEEPAPRQPPEFVLKPKPCTAFEGSCARFCCRVVGNPKPRPTWMVNNQTVVSGSRYKLTYDGMHHLIIPKCQLSDAGIVKVYARNLLGDCFCTTELQVKKKVDDYRGVLKNSPNPWYDEQSLKMYQRQRSQDLTDDEEFLQSFQQLTQRMQMASEQQSTSPFGNQVVGYMEPGTPDVNLLARTQSPLVEPGDLHPVVTERQVAMMAPAPSTIQRALKVKDSISAIPEKPFQSTEAGTTIQSTTTTITSKTSEIGAPSDKLNYDSNQNIQPQQSITDQRVFGLNSQQTSVKQQQQQQQQQGHEMINQEYQSSSRQSEFDLSQMSTISAGSRLDHRFPPPSPENKDYGKEVHSHIHKQTQMERRANQEIIREIIEKETFEQEHSGMSRENVVRGDSVDRGSTPSIMSDSNSSWAKYQSSSDDQRKHQQQVSLQHQQTGFQSTQRQQHTDEQLMFIEEHMTPPEFIQKIQPCQAIDGDEAKFECTFKGDPKPTISWFRENKMIKPSNLYNIVTDLKEDKSTLTIKRVNTNSSAVYTVKAENLAGSAKSSANLVVEPHPLPQTSRRAGHARQVDYNQDPSAPSLDVAGASSSYTSTSITTSKAETSLSARDAASNQQQYFSEGDDTSTSDSQKVVKSVRTRKISSDEMAALIRRSPEGLIAPTFLHILYDISVAPGDLARFDARIVGSQPMEVRWVKDGQRVRADKSHKMILEGDLYSLLILECSPKNAGNYECVVSNPIGEARCGARLTMSDKRASVSRTPDQMSAADQYISSSSSQAALVPSSGVSESHWSQKQSWSSGEVSGQKTHYGLTRHQYNPLLGQWTSALAGGDKRRTELPRVIKRLENQQVREGKSLTLRCQISSFPMAEVHWYKEGDKLIKPSKYFRIFKDNDETYCLKILEVFAEDQGEYKCVARAPNGQSQVETKATITVIPSSPR